VKNALIFVPMLAAHQLPNSDSVIALLGAFVSLSLVASAFYVVNDIVDVDSDRAHPKKQHRPIASGAMLPRHAHLLAVVLLICATAIGASIGSNFLVWLAIYALVTSLYTFRVKRIVLLDCFVLATLYSLRVVAGGTVVDIAPSFWLLATSGFLFLSLAFGKRFAEIAVSRELGRETLPGRAYRVDDAPVILAIGVSAAFMSVLVLALYVNSEAVTVLYRTPLAIWGTVPVLLLWITSIWFRLWRGEVSDDPVLFAIRDRVSVLCGFAVLILVIAGAEGWML
jgi:4-hydroxybenzoate polyprenyltransferase